MTTLDVLPGQLYRFLTEGLVLYSVVRERSDEILEFRNELSHRTKNIPVAKFEQMRGDGRAVRVSKAVAATSRSIEIAPDALFEIEDGSSTKAQKIAKKRIVEKMLAARTLRYYVQLYDETPKVGLSTRALDRFLAANFEGALYKGLEWKPSASAIRRALKKYGTLGDRPLVAFLGRGLHDPIQRWPKITADLKSEMIELYWGSRSVSLSSAQSSFYKALTAADEFGQARGNAALVFPKAETLRLWINKEECHARWKTRYGKGEADRRFKGRNRPIEATRILEYVIFDHTRVDNWNAVYDDDGILLSAERPWLTLAIDLYSRLILGAILAYEPPSIHTVMQCLKQVIRRKQFLIDEFGAHRGATDGWGKPASIIVDQGWEFASMSSQVACESAGINIIWAPVRTPEFKPHVERTFDTLNKLVWHPLPSGIPYKPQRMKELGLEPQKKAFETIEQSQERLWRGIVTIYHVRVHDGVGMAPARAWVQGLKKTRRPTIDDLAGLDKLLGKAKTCKLSAEGIYLKNQRFHDPRITTDLLDDLLRYARKLEQRKGQSSGTCEVTVVLFPEDCSSIQVWNPRRKTSQHLPNWNPKFSNGCSWHTAEKVREYADRQNLAFHSDAEMWTARADYLASIPNVIRSEPFRVARKLIRTLQSEKAKEIPGDTIVESFEEPTADGIGGTNIPMVIPAYHRDDNRSLAKGPRRGGAAATRKAQKTRARNKAGSNGANLPRSRMGAKVSVSNNATVIEPLFKPCTIVEDGDALLAALSKDIE